MSGFQEMKLTNMTDDVRTKVNNPLACLTKNILPQALIFVGVAVCFVIIVADARYFFTFFALFR